MVSLVVQWLGLYALIAEGLGSIPGQGTKGPRNQVAWPKRKKERKKERKKAACMGLLRAAMTLSAGLGSEDKQLIQANAMSSLLNGVLLTEVCRLMGFCAI